LDNKKGDCSWLGRWTGLNKRCPTVRNTKKIVVTISALPGKIIYSSRGDRVNHTGVGAVY